MRPPRHAWLLLELSKGRTLLGELDAFELVFVRGEICAHETMLLPLKASAQEAAATS